MRKSLLNTFSFILLFLFVNQTQAQEELVKDINPGGGWSEFEYLFHLGDNFYFAANGDSGRELWISDGTPDGTEELIDINVGFIGSNPSQFVELNGIWYFTADNGVTGAELWRTDGTAAGTTILKDIHPGFPSSDIGGMVNINGNLYFEANDGAAGFELWISDGTTAGTNMLTDLNPGVSSSSPEHMTLLGTDIYFAANDGTNGKEIWKTDGTLAGTSLVADVFTGIDSSFPADLTAVGNFVYFTADDGVVGREIYKTDGTPAGTSLQGDINPGISPSNATDLIAVGNYLFLSANDGTNGTELWRSDATSATPDLQMIELFAGAFSTLPTNFIKLNDDLIFNANDGTNGYELWIANASDGSVNLVKNISPNFNSSNPVMLDVLNNEVIFAAKDSAIGVELWKTDGTEAGTILLGDLNPALVDTSNSFPQLPYISDGIMYFTATDDVNGWQIWRTDGTISATQRLTSMPHDTIFNNSYKPYAVNSVGNTSLNFVALGDAVGEELWRYSLDPITIDDVSTINNPLNCTGDSDGAIEVLVSGGVGDPSCFTYAWSDPSLSGLSVSNLAAGDYELTVTDCVGFTVTTNIMIAEPSAIAPVTTLISDAACFGEASGSASVTASGGASSYTYAWDNGETTAVAISLLAGNHDVTVTDANNCTSVGTVNVGEPTPVTASAAAGTPICFGASNGTATASGAGGTPSYTYEWDNGETTATAVNLTGGDHTVTVTDINGCHDITTVTLTTGIPLEFQFSSVAATCPGVTNGTASVMTSGGSGLGYTYLWSTGSMTDESGAVTGGTYIVTVTDSNGCTGEGSVIVENPEVYFDQVTGETCAGNADGQAEIVVDGTTGSYSYAWDNGETSALATMLTVGLHEVTISEATGCSFVETVTIEGSVALTAPSPMLAPSCPDDQNGVAFYSPTGGTLPYTFTWSTGTITNDGILSELAGNAEYCVTITEAGNCTEFTDCFVIENQVEIVNSFQGEVLPSSCVSACDGSLEAVPTGGGSSMYNFTWSTGETTTGAASSVANQICYGFTYVTITDGMCAIVDTFFNGTQPNALEASLSSTDVACFGGSDGSIDITAIGGVPPYTFDGPAADLPAGDYVAVVTDATGCSVSLSYVINQPEELVVEIGGAIAVTCNGASDASVTVIVTGGTEPYTVNGETEDLGAGTYTIEVVDANACMLEVSFDILEPAAFTATGTTTPAMGADNGTASVSIVGGSGPYSYSWNTTPEQTTPTAIDLAGGDYTCVITDANGCTTSADVTVDFLESTNDLEALSLFEMLPNPASSNVIINFELDQAFDVRMDIVDALGRVVETKNYDKVQAQQVDLDVSAFAQGVYMVRLTTKDGQKGKRLMVVR